MTVGSNYRSISENATTQTMQSLVRYADVQTDGTGYYAEIPGGGYHQVEAEGLPVFEATAGEVTTRYAFDPVLDTLTPLVEVYDVDHASMPAWSADPGSIWSADPIGDSWTQTDTYTEGGSTYTVFAQPGTGDLYAFLTSDVGGTTSYSITGKAHIEDQPDVGGQLASGAFDLANYTLSLIHI